MFYIVTARLVPSNAADFYRKLTDGTIAKQRPDGPEIVASMRRARIRPDGSVRWSEQCFCATPLAHERETVLDRYFTGLRTTEVEAYREFEGEPLMDELAALAVGIAEPKVARIVAD